MKTAMAAGLGAVIACCLPAQAERFDCSAFRGFQAQFACYDNLSRAPAPPETQRPIAVKPHAASARQRKHKAD